MIKEIGIGIVIGIVLVSFAILGFFIYNNFNEEIVQPDNTDSIYLEGGFNIYDNSLDYLPVKIPIN